MSDDEIFYEWIGRKFIDGKVIRITIAPEQAEMLKNTLEFQSYLLRKRAKLFLKTFIQEIKNIITRGL